MREIIKEHAEVRIVNHRKIYVIGLNKLLNAEVAKTHVIYNNCKKSIDKLIDAKKTVLEFILFLIRSKKYTVQKYDSNTYFSIYANRKKKTITIYDKKLVIGAENICKDCNEKFINIHTCRTDKVQRRLYLQCKLPKITKSTKIFDIVLDIESAFINNFHVPVLICIKYVLGEKHIEKFFYNASQFFKWLEEFARFTCPINSRINLIGFNSSRYDFIFFMREVRKFVTKSWTFHKDKYNYIQKGGAIIYSTFYLDTISVWFIDILRYTGGVTSLKQIVRDLKIDQEKGAFPFKILAESNIKRNKDGFIDLSYFDSKEDFEACYKLWISKNKCSDFELLKYYCQIDVQVTYKVWIKICEMYNSYVPFMKDVHITKFHGAPSLTKWISFKMALDNENLESIVYYNSSEIKSTKKPKSIKIYAPNFESYFLWSESVYGGWVGCHAQGLINEQLGMVDIVSHYPTSFTSYYGIGKPRSMTSSELLHFSSNIASYDLNNLPLFCCECEITRPSVITDFCSPLPQRVKGTLTWSYVNTNQNLNSVDIWHCVKHYNFKIKLMKGEIFTKKCLLFRKFVETFARMKDDGKCEKNDLKTKCGKIGLNSGIGKYGEKKERFISKIVMTDEDRQHVHFLLSTNNKFVRHELIDIVPHRNYDEYVLKEFDVSCNLVPLHIISFMFAYSRVIKMDLIKRSKTNNLHIFSDRIKLPTPIYGDTDSIVITARELRHLKKNSPTLFQPSIGFYNTATAQFDYHIEIEDLFKSDTNTIPHTKLAIFFGLKAYMIVTTSGHKYKCKGHRISQTKTLCECGSGDKKWFCIGCLETNRDKKVDVEGVTLQHFYNCISGEHHKFTYKRLEKQLNRPIGKGKKSFTVRNKEITISLNYKELCHKYDVKNNFCYPFIS